MAHWKNRNDPQECTNCGSNEVENIINAPAIYFKGDGFYINDSKADAQRAAKEHFEGKGKSDK